MERIRRRQQEAYEEEARRRLEKKQAVSNSNDLFVDHFFVFVVQQLEAAKASANDNATRTKFRSSDHNPMTGQSSRSDGGSCAWRPSGRRKPAGG